MNEQYKLNEWDKLQINMETLDKICDNVLGSKPKYSFPELIEEVIKEIKKEDSKSPLLIYKDYRYPLLFSWNNYITTVIAII